MSIDTTDSFFSLPELPPLPMDGQKQAAFTALAGDSPFILVAPPGTGKSTRVPLWALAATPGRIILLEPRRLAARMLAGHLAALLHCRVGETVGLAMRRETRMSSATRMLVVTEGVFIRMIRDDQELTGISCVLFDEFHERSLASDTGLALALESRSILRPDLHIGILSATPDIEALTALLPEASVITAKTRSFPVTIRWEPDRTPGLYSLDARLSSLPAHCASVILRALAAEQGSLLCFLPGIAAIQRTAEQLEGRLPATCDLYLLSGSLSIQEQHAILAPAQDGRRKVVLSTDIAETSLTIEGIRIVVDSGLQRRPRFDPATGSSRLLTKAIPLSSAIQRSGRAGRLSPGLCIRLWSRESEAGMQQHTAPEILDADLTQLAFDLALWGAPASELPFLTQPPAAAMQAGTNLLQSLGAIDADGRPTPSGRAMARTGLSPRIAAVLLAASPKEAYPAALVCAALEEAASAGARPTTPDFVRAVSQLSHSNSLSAYASSLLRRRPDNKTLPKPPTGALSAEQLGRLLLPGFADRIAARAESPAAASTRPVKQQETAAGQTRWICRDGRRLFLIQGIFPSSCRFLLALEASSESGTGRITLACPLPADVLSLLPGDALTTTHTIETKDGRIYARKRTFLGAILLSEQPVANPTPEDIAQAFTDQILQQGLSALPLTDACTQWLARVTLLREQLGEDWPDVHEASLLAGQEQWLPRLLDGVRDLNAIAPQAILQAWKGLLPGRLARDIDRLAPTTWQAPSGKTHPIRYLQTGPQTEVKLQECFGLTRTPVLPCGVPLLLHLVSPAGAPLAITKDLASFWKEGYPSVRSQMRGRYPKHPWPEDPFSLAPTALTNKRLAAQKSTAPHQDTQAKGKRS